MSYKQQIANLEATRKAKAVRMKEIQAKATDQGRTLDTGEQEEFDSLKGEIGTIDKNIGNLRDLESMEDAEAKSAKPVDDSANRSATVAIQRSAPAEARNTQKLEKGVGFARIARVKALARLDNAQLLDVAKTLYPGDDQLIKAVTPAANTGDDGWAGNLILDRGAYFADFVEYLRETTVLGQIADRLRRLPFDAPVLMQSTGGTAQWVGEGAPKPVTQWSYARTKLTPLKVAAIAAATKEQLRRASVASDALLRDELGRAVGATVDGTFVSANAAVADVSPAGIRNGVTALTLTGDGSVAGIRQDIAAFLKALVGANLTVAGAFWLMPETLAIDLSLVANEVGATAFPGMGPTGGTLAGLPAFTSQYVPANVVMLVRGDEVFLGDEGGIEVAMSDQASLQMDTEPTNDSVTPTATQLVSMFQTNSVAFLVERFINWSKRRSQAVVWGTVNWGTQAGS